MVASSGSRRIPRSKVAGNGPRPRLVVAAVAVALAVGLAGFALGRWPSAISPISVYFSGPTVVGEAEGTVSIVNSTGRAICLTTATGGDQVFAGVGRPRPA